MFETNTYELFFNYRYMTQNTQIPINKNEETQKIYLANQRGLTTMIFNLIMWYFESTALLQP